jgi:hypothetical protein
MTSSALRGTTLPFLAFSLLAATTRLAAQPDATATPEPVEVRVAPLADTVVREGADANYGDQKWLAIGGMDPWSPVYSIPANAGYQWSFLKFDTSAAAHVSAARLRLYGARSSKGVGDSWARVLSASSSWMEHGLRSISPAYAWNGRNWHHDRNRAALDRVRLPNDKTDRWYEWDVSEWVVGERAAGRHVVTLVVVGEIENGSPPYAEVALFHSREAETNKPELVLAATAPPVAQPVVTAPAKVVVPAATGKPDEPDTRSNSAPMQVRVAALADIDFSSDASNKYRNRKSLAIGPWSSTRGISGTAGDESCTTQVVEQAINTAEGMAVGAVALSGQTNCYSSPSGGQSYHGSGDQWSILKFDTGAAAQVSSARLRLYGARKGKSAVALQAELWSALGTSDWRDPGWSLRLGEVLDRVELAKDDTKRWYEWDVSEWVRRERAAGRSAVMFALGGDGLASFHSREAKSNQPELVLVP